MLALSAVAYTASAQFYINAGLGYAIPQAGQTIDGTTQPYNGSVANTTYTSTYNIKAASFCAGTQGVLGLGYMFSDHVGVQMDALIGIATKKYTFSEDSVRIGGIEKDVSTIQKAKNPVFLAPSLVLQTGGNVLNIYARFGVAIPLNTKITQDQIQTDLPGQGAREDLDFTIQVKNSFSLGFTGAAGVKYKISDKVCIWGEISMLSMSVYIKEADVTAFTYNGVSQSVSYVSPQSVKYSKNVVTDTNGNTAPTYSQPFSNVGIHVGISFSIGEKRQRGSNHFNGGEGDDNKKPFKRR